MGLKDMEFVEIAETKGDIIEGVTGVLPFGWYWMVTEETETKIVIEIRKIKKGEQK